MKSFRDLKVGLDEDLKEKLSWMTPNYTDFRILRKSVDARRSSDAHFVYSIDVYEEGEKPSDPVFEIEKVTLGSSFERPIIIGSGPAGLFAAIRFAERGIPCVLLERGSVGSTRIQKINQYWRYGVLDPDNNVCFGEGGAGLYSDGKLITRIKSPLIPYVMDRFVKFGAPEEIRYLSNPHVGSDRIRRVIPHMREYLQANGCEMIFDAPMASLIVENSSTATATASSSSASAVSSSGVSQTAQIVGVRTRDGREFRSSHVVLATGHSAEDVFSHLSEIGVFMEGKSFALGLRIEHPQKLINRIQYRRHADHPSLGAANYRLAHHDDSTGIGVYSFCMCPGGYVLSSGTSPDGVVANGMSNYHRNSPFANSAVVVSIDHDKRFGTSSLFAGLEFRRSLEQAAFKAVQAKDGGHKIPVQNVVSFMEGRDGEALKSSSPSGVAPVRLDQILPEDITNRLRHSLQQFNRHMRGFITSEAQFHGIESRTSCPVRVTRDTQTLQSLSHAGLYPTGEGAGYAGGITSAACDGIRVAEAIVASLASQQVATVR